MPTQTRHDTSQDWLDALRSEGPARDRAIADLHALLLRAARFEVAGRGGRDDDLAVQAADDALMAILAKLDDFRGASRFTTWAYKFALLEAGVKTRRRAWQGREIPLESDQWPALSDGHERVESAEILEGLKDAMGEVLTEHQREVFVALALNEVPIDVLAQRRGTTRGALYKTLHDARARLRQELASRGLVEAR